MQNDAMQGINPRSIGASDIPMLVQESTYGSPLSLWFRVTGRTNWDDSTSASAEWGLLIEDAIINHFEINFLKPRGLEFTARQKRLIHPEIDHYRATPDAVLEAAPEPFVFDAKNYAAQSHILQALWQMWVFNENAKAENRPVAEFAIYHIAGLNREPQPEIYRWNQELFDTILAMVEKFWEENILRDMPPEADAHLKNKEMLAKLMPISDMARKDKKRKTATPEVKDLLRRYAWLREAGNEIAEAKRHFEYQILQFIGSDYGVDGEDAGGMIWYETVGAVKYVDLIEYLAVKHDIPVSEIIELKQDSRFRGKSSRTARYLSPKK